MQRNNFKSSLRPVIWNSSWYDMDNTVIKTVYD